MLNLNASQIKTDIALLLSMVAGILGLLGITLNVPGVDQALNDILAALLIIVPMVAQVVRELQHLKITTPKAAPIPVPPAPDGSSVPAT